MFSEVKRAEQRARKRRSTQELRDLDVDRVDGVDKPATGRSFLLFKAEDAGMAPTSRFKAPTQSRTYGFAPADSWLVDPTQGYQFEEPDGDERHELNLLTPDEERAGAEGGKFERGVFDNVVFGVTPRAMTFDLKDQPSRGAERGDDRPQWVGLDADDAIPPAGSGPRVLAPRSPSSFRTPDGREWVQKRDPDLTFRCSFSSILD